MSAGRSAGLMESLVDHCCDCIIEIVDVWREIGAENRDFDFSDGSSFRLNGHVTGVEMFVWMPVSEEDAKAS